MKTLKKIGEEACNNTYCDRCRCDLKAIEGGRAVIKEFRSFLRRSPRFKVPMAYVFKKSIRMFLKELEG